MAELYLDVELKLSWEEGLVWDRIPRLGRAAAAAAAAVVAAVAVALTFDEEDDDNKERSAG